MGRLERASLLAIVGIVMRRQTLTIAWLLAATVASAQPQKPDFSGDRVLDRQASTLSPAMAGVQSGSLRIQHREPDVSVHLTLVLNGQPFDTVVEGTTDGREVSRTQQERSSASSFKWDGKALVFAARAQTKDCEGTVSIRYDLEDNGRRLRATETIRGCGRDQDNIWMFERP
jgi:hypothetical protein